MARRRIFKVTVFQKAMVWLGLQEDDEYAGEHENVQLAEEVQTRNQTHLASTAPMQRSMNPTQANEGARPRPQQAPTLKVARPATIRPSGSPQTSVSVQPKAAANAVNVVEPKGFNDAQQIGDCLKENKPVIVNLQNMSKDLQRRLIDFSSGLTYGLEGGMSRVGENVFLLTPNDVEVSDEEKQNLTAQGLYSL
jgi:cell division inhibitor SepF